MWPWAPGQDSIDSGIPALSQQSSTLDLNGNQGKPTACPASHPAAFFVCPRAPPEWGRGLARTSLDAT